MSGFDHIFCFVWVWFGFWDMISLCNHPDCLGTRFVDQAGLEFTEVPLPLPPTCWDSRFVSQSLGQISGFILHLSSRGKSELTPVCWFTPEGIDLLPHDQQCLWHTGHAWEIRKKKGGDLKSSYCIHVMYRGTSLCLTVELASQCR